MEQLNCINPLTFFQIPMDLLEKVCTLPVEILVEHVGFQWTQFLQLRFLNRRWKKYIDEHPIWKYYIKKYYSTNLPDQPMNYKQLFIMHETNISGKYIDYFANTMTIIQNDIDPHKGIFYYFMEQSYYVSYKTGYYFGTFIGIGPSKNLGMEKIIPFSKLICTISPDSLVEHELMGLVDFETVKKDSFEFHFKFIHKFAKGDIRIMADMKKITQRVNSNPIQSDMGGLTLMLKNEKEWNSNIASHREIQRKEINEKKIEIGKKKFPIPKSNKE